MFCKGGLAQYGLYTVDPILIKADSLYQKGEIEKAHQLYQSFIQENSEGRPNRSNIVALLGTVPEISNNGEYEVAFKILGRIKEEQGNLLTHELMAYMKYMEAGIYSDQGEQEKSLKAYYEGLQLAYKSEEKFRIAQLQYFIGKTLVFEGKAQEGRDILKRALKIFNELNSDYWLISTKNELGVAQFPLGNNEEAERYFLQAIKEGKQYGNKRLLGSIYYNYAELKKKTGKYSEALEYLKKQEKLLEFLDSYEVEADVYNAIGAVYSYLADAKSSLDYYNRALRARQEGGLDRDPVILSNIALVYHSLGDYELAESLYMEALGVFEDRNSTYWIIKMNEFLADLGIDRNEPEVAIEYAKRAVNLVRNYQNKDLKSSAHLTLARAYSYSGDQKKALPHFKASYENTRNIRGFNLVYALTRLSGAYYRAGSDSAFVIANRAIEEIEWLRGNISGDQLQTEVFRSYAAFFFKVASWHIELNDDFEKAFEMLEKGKSRSLLDQVAGSSSLDQFVDENTSLNILSKSKEIDRLYREFEASDNDEFRTEIKNQINDARLDYQLTINKAYSENPNFKKLSAPEIITLREAKKLLDEHSAIVEFATFDDKLLTLVITQNIEQAFIQEIADVRYSRKYFSRFVNGLRGAIQDIQPIDSLQYYSEPLYELLLKPIESNFPEIKNLILVPDVALNYLPFEALLAPNGEFAIQQYNIKYLPSISLYKYIPEPHRETEEELLAVASSGFQGEESSEELRSQQNFASLPSTLLEVDSIATKFENFTLLKNEDVSEAAIKQLDLENYKYLHFAAHGTVNEDDPSQSGLVLSKRNNLEGLFGEDGLLNSAEISLLNLKADLVVLSACNTGYGRNVVGEGLLGLQRAFLKAGSSSVIVSLWSVYDKSTAFMMADFYEKMNNYKDKDIGLWSKAMIWMDLYEAPMFGYKERALRDAKLAMIEHPYYHHPVNWASFILIGK